MTSQGQVVVPARLRRKYAIKEGTKVRFLERDREIVLQPITREHIRGACGIRTSTLCTILNALTAEGTVRKSAAGYSVVR